MGPCRYAFYSHVVSTRMLPLRRMVRWTQHSRARLGMPQDRCARLGCPKGAPQRDHNSVGDEC